MAEYAYWLVNHHGYHSKTYKQRYAGARKQAVVNVGLPGTSLSGGMLKVHACVGCALCLLVDAISFYPPHLLTARVPCLYLFHSFALPCALADLHSRLLYTLQVFVPFVERVKEENNWDKEQKAMLIIDTWSVSIRVEHALPK